MDKSHPCLFSLSDFWFTRPMVHSQSHTFSLNLLICQPFDQSASAKSLSQPITQSLIQTLAWSPTHPARHSFTDASLILTDHWLSQKLTQWETHPKSDTHSPTRNQSVIEAHSYSPIQTLTHPLGHSLIVPDTHRDTYPPSTKFNHPLSQTLAKEVNQCLRQCTSQWKIPYLRNKWHIMWTSKWPWNKLLYASSGWYDEPLNMSVSRVVIERVQKWFA